MAAVRRQQAVASLAFMAWRCAITAGGYAPQSGSRKGADMSTLADLLADDWAGADCIDMAASEFESPELQMMHEREQERTRVMMGEFSRAVRNMETCTFPHCACAPTSRACPCV